MPKESAPCQWISLKEALQRFARAEFATQGQRHIKPLHWYIACRLCLEGGFDPDEITPRPPFRVKNVGSGSHTRRIIEHNPSSGGSNELTILGGLKTKQVDVVVTKPNIGPVIAVSMKGTLNAFRNLTNRMEEAGGDCTNLHITYPSLVYAYWGVMRANKPEPIPSNAPAALFKKGSTMHINDIAVLKDGSPHPLVVRYHQALASLTGRNGIRNDVSRYEVIALALVDVEDAWFGEVFDGYPPASSDLHLSKLLPTIYKHYDQRFLYQAPDLKKLTGRKGWDESSQVLKDWKAEEYDLRILGDDESEDEQQESS